MILLVTDVHRGCCHGIAFLKVPIPLYSDTLSIPSTKSKISADYKCDKVLVCAWYETTVKGDSKLRQYLVGVYTNSDTDGGIGTLGLTESQGMTLQLLNY